MRNTANLQNILAFLGVRPEVAYWEIIKNFSDLNESTVVRNLEKLIQSGKANKITKGKYTFYRAIGPEYTKKYLEQSFFDRPKKSYNFDFLGSYIPNVTTFLGDAYSRIQSEYLDTKTLSTYDYRENIRAIENLLIDLSFSSSKLEGNTYSYLDTEVLIKYNTSPDGKSPFETQMILNHKNAIKYIIENRIAIEYVNSEFQNIHRLLGEWLLLDGYLGKIRTSEVSIGGSAYTPLDNYFLLSEQFDIFLQKLNHIKNPFEQSLFILVFIPYFQIFMDINKRTSRISANIPLLKNGLVPFSFLQMKDRDYIDAILAIYELNDVSLMREIFVSNYLLNMRRYL